MPVAAPVTNIIPSRLTRSVVRLSFTSFSLRSLTWNLCPHEGHVLRSIPRLDVKVHSAKALLSSSIP